MASRCISNRAPLRPPSASPNSLFHGLQMHLQTSSIMASNFARLGPPTASPTSHNHCLQVHIQIRTITASTFAWLRPPSASPNSLHYGLQVHLWVHSISKRISKLLRSRLPNTSLSSHDDSLLRRRSSHGIRREFVSTGSSGSRSVGRGSEDMKQYLAVRNRTNWVHLSKFGNGAWDQELGKIYYVFHILRWYLSIRGSPKYILPIA